MCDFEKLYRNNERKALRTTPSMRIHVEIQDPSCTIRTFSARELLYGVSTTTYLRAFVKKVYEMVRWSKDTSFCRCSWSGQSGVYSLYSQDISGMIKLYMLSSGPTTFSNTVGAI